MNLRGSPNTGTFFFANNLEMRKFSSGQWSLSKIGINGLLCLCPKFKASNISTSKFSAGVMEYSGSKYQLGRSLIEENIFSLGKFGISLTVGWTA